ncbi:MAG: rRNA maturation RNase YbeY [Patescibacteria group bacterium]
MFDIVNKTEVKPPASGLFLKKIKNKIVGQDYELSVVFAENTLSQDLNNKYRNKNHPTNVLSFPLGETAGEIFMDLSKIEEEAKNIKLSYQSYFVFIFIHGLLHLKGLDHGKGMSDQEKKFLEDFDIKIPPELEQFFKN